MTKRTKTEFDRDFERWMKDPEFAEVYRETRALIDAGDVDGLAAAMRRDAEGLADRLAARNRDVSGSAG